MKEFLGNIIGPVGITPPDSCLKAFNEQFSNALRTEWSLKGRNYEAIFYRDNLEHIALYHSDGELLEYKMSLPPDYLPEAIKGELEEMGEIMNSVLINKGNGVEYEIILRDKSLARHLVMLTGVGRIIERRQL